MPNLEMYRQWQFENLRRGVLIAGTLANLLSDEEATIYRDGGTGWTVLEVLCHLRDFEGLFLQRAQLTVEQDNPTLDFPDPDGLAVERQYNQQDVQAVIVQWREKREAFLAYLEDRSPDDWEQVAAHPKRGPFTLHDQLFLATWHDSVHLDQITKIMAEKQTS